MEAESQSAEANVGFLLIGTKTDLADDALGVSTVEAQQVAPEEAQALAAEHSWLHYETNAKTGSHVRDAFYLLACTMTNAKLESDPKNIIKSTVGTAGPAASEHTCANSSMIRTPGAANRLQNLP